MAQRPARSRPIATLQVLRTERLTPHLIRVVAGGAGLAGFEASEFTDSYVKVLFLAPGADYPEPLELTRIQREYPREQWPVSRTYTVRAFDPAARELTVDFVYHDDRGLAGPWAAAARPGDPLHVVGPGGAYAPRADVDWHLLIGDETALPAISAAIEALPAAARCTALVEVTDAGEELDVPGGAPITWLHRGSGEPGGVLVDAVLALEFPPGRVQAFAHGEAGVIKRLRHHLRTERDIPAELLSISGYWRRGLNEEGFREYKRLQRQEAEQTAGVRS
ncbi:MAG: siderophore-interacting protein [Sciscionella sp.]